MVAFNPDTITVLSGGKFLYASNGGAQTISTFALQSGTGKLGFVRETAKCMGGTASGPIMRSDPSGKFVYSTGASGKNCSGGNAIIGFSVNQTTGNLTAIPGLPLSDSNPTGPVSGAIVVVP
jgi:6-phosphogluconolactonase (cycloisomerase 2 family)